MKYFFGFAVLIMILSIILIFLTEPNSNERLLSYGSLVVSAIVLIGAVIFIRRER